MATTAGESSKSTKNPAPRGRPRKPRSPNEKKLTKEQLISLLSSATSAAHSFLSSNDLHLLPSQSLSLESLLFSLPFSSPPSLSSSFFHRFISSADSNLDPRWYDIFRMSKPTFLNLLSLLSPSLSSFLPPSIPPDSAVASTLFRLAHGACYEACARRFGLVSPSAACLAFYSVCKVVNESLGNLVDFRSDMERITVGFGWISLPNCCGVLGFGKFGIDSGVLGKNGSLLVQALVDSEGRFLDISAGWPSTMKPCSIFSKTKLYSRIEESKELLNGPSYQLGDGNSVPQYILGDFCFPLYPWLLTPYIRPNEEDSFGSAEREFNDGHKRAMRLLNTAFRRVKVRWQLLANRWKEECVEFFPFVIVMGCLLHNFLIKCSESIPEESVGCFVEEEELPVFQGEADERGQRIRDALAMHLSRVSMRK